MLVNRLLGLLHLDDYAPSDEPQSEDLEEILTGILDNYEILTIMEKNQLWKLVLKKVTVYRSQNGELSIQLYPNLPK